MSDPKRATLITVGAPKSAKNNVNKTVRLTINLDESNESKYPELNYKELVIAEERKKRVENGKNTGLDPYSENNEDVERIARKFEQKYGGKSTYGRKGRSKHDDFADIGAGYDENDSFIDNTHGYDEMIPPECDTLYGGFYINCGSLEFKNVPENQSAMSDGEPGSSRRNKRRISSSSSEDESSESSSESESQDEKDPKAIANGDIDCHKTEHRKKKNKKIDKKKAKKVRRTDSSAATSGKQTSDDNAHGDGESADSRTSQSDSLTSKPAPSSENAITSDSSRDTESKVEVKLPSAVIEALEALEAYARTSQTNSSSTQNLAHADQFTIAVSRALSLGGCGSRARRAGWARAAAALRTSSQLLRQRAAAAAVSHDTPTTTIAQSTSNTITTASTTVSSTSTTVPLRHDKRKVDDDLEDFDSEQLTAEQREAMIKETLKRLEALINERKPAMIANYNAECERVQNERKKLAARAVCGAAVPEKRLPKRRFPWCGRARGLLARLARLAGAPPAALRLLQDLALPLFPPGFVRMPTLLRQADLSKEIKATDLKRQRLGSASQAVNPPAAAAPAAAAPAAAPLAAAPPAAAPVPAGGALGLAEPIQFPSSLTVTTTTKHSPDKTELPGLPDDKTPFNNAVFGSIINSFTLSKDLIVEKPDKKDTEKKEELYIPPNNIGSITITPVPNNPPKPEKKLNNNVQVTEKTTGLLRVKSPAALNEMVKKDKVKKPEKSQSIVKEKRVASPLHIDTSYQPSKKDPSPKQKDEIPQKQIENMRVAENNIPRPALVPVHHSPTFAKPDKRPPEVKKKKDVVIISDVDPLSDQQEPLAVDDSSSDVEVVEDNRTDKSEPKRDKSETVPSKDLVNDTNKKVNSVKCRKEKEVRKSDSEEATNDDIDTLMRNLREMEHSQEPTKFNSNSFGGVLTNAKHERSSSQPSFPRSSVFGEARDRDKLTERTSLNKMDGCNAITG
ncbi:yemanuclein [Trichoplusia ni]|uniref:Yemanuclein n=1 Tax=Trichoplusia ni TaxID=7111 RepID=A0A7E5WJ56_TRINI|nr:yemanuclein [Trichoplusia ni]